jgi:two-component system cell cycle response regulator
MMRQVAQLGMLTRKLRATSLTDALTELPNRRYAMKRLKSEWVSAGRTGKPISLIMADIDRFKLVNDTFGHDAGDSVLRRTAQVIRGSFRKSDEVCRLGGEEFLIICKNTSAQDAGMIADRARVALKAEVIKLRDGDVSVTASFGVACSSELDVGIDELLKAADEAVYEAKRTGRDRIYSSTAKTEDRKSA